MECVRRKERKKKNVTLSGKSGRTDSIFFSFSFSPNKLSTASLTELIYDQNDADEKIN